MNTPIQEIQLRTRELGKLRKDKLKKIFPATTVFLAIMLVVMVSLSLSEVLEDERIDLDKEQYDRLTPMTHLLIRTGKNTNLYLGYEKAMVK